MKKIYEVNLSEEDDPLTDEQREVMLEVAAKSFWLDCRNDKEYSCESWRDELKEMRGNLSDSFLRTCYKLYKDDPRLLSLI